MVAKYGPCGNDYIWPGGCDAKAKAVSFKIYVARQDCTHRSSCDVRQRKISHIRGRVPSLDDPLGLPFLQAAGHVGRDVEGRVGLEEDGLHESLRSNARVR